VIEQISSKFTITDLGEVSKYLNIHVVRTPEYTFLHQKDYTQSIINKYLNFEKVVAKTPIPPGTSMCKMNSVYVERNSENVPHDIFEFDSLIGSLMYLSNNTRPDIAYSVNCLCRYMSCPSQQHYYYAQHIVAYLNSTVDYGIFYKKGDGVKFSAYCDASFCSDADTSRSVSGNVMLINDTAISWHSCLQSTVCLSTTESEYLSMGLVGKECLWMKYLLNEILPFDTVMNVHVGAHEQYVELKVAGKKPEQIEAGTLIYSDSKSAIQIVNDTESIKKTKHIKAIHHWIREREFRSKNYPLIMLILRTTLQTYLLRHYLCLSLLS